MIKTWQVTPAQSVPLDLRAASLDEVTRQLPLGFYSTFRTFAECTRVLGLAAHLRRLYEPVLLPEVDVSLLRQQLFSILETYRPGEARVRAIMTKKGQVYLAAEPLKPLAREVYEKGVRAETTELQRRQPRLKSTGFIERSDAERNHIAQEGIFEALLVRGGKILEGMTSNFFYVGQAGRERQAKQQSRKRDTLPYLGTARENILLGITRETVLEVARRLGVDVKYEPLKLTQLELIHEAFITSSTRGIVPVVRIDQMMIGQGRPGPITRQLSAQYDSYVIEKAESIL